MYETAGGVKLGVKLLSSHMFIALRGPNKTGPSTAHWRPIMPLMISEIFRSPLAVMPTQGQELARMAKKHKWGAAAFSARSSRLRCFCANPRRRGGTRARAKPSECDT